MVWGSGSLDSMWFKVLSSVHMAQAAAAQDLSQEQVSAPETQAEAATSPEKGELGKAMEAGTAKVYDFLKFKADKAKADAKNLGTLETAEVQFSPEISKQIESANDDSYKKIDDLTAKTIELVKVVSGEEIAEIAPTPVEVPKPVVEEKPAVVVQPIVEVKPVEKPIEAPVLRNEVAEQQKSEAEISIKEDEDALRGFAGEHGLSLDVDLNIADAQLKNLTSTERTYIAVLQSKYRAGHDSAEHAKALMAVAAETDPTKKSDLAKKAFELSEKAKVSEIAATALNAEYMALPEIMALSVSAPPGNATGGSIEGQNFEVVPDTGGGTAGGPEGPKGPQGPDLTLIKGGSGKRGPGFGSPLYTDQVHGGPPGLVKIEPVKGEAYHPKKAEPEHINFFRRWVIDQGNTIGKMFGLGGGGGGGGKPKSGGGDHH
jgi:hypothetical protein